LVKSQIDTQVRTRTAQLTPQALSATRVIAVVLGASGSAHYDVEGGLPVSNVLVSTGFAFVVATVPLQVAKQFGVAPASSGGTESSSRHNTPSPPMNAAFRNRLVVLSTTHDNMTGGLHGAA